MTGTLHANTIQKANGSPVELTGQSAAKAWSNLNGTGTIAERDSFNISGYVDNGTGDYTFTLSSDMSDANYIASGSACDPGTTSGHIWQLPAVADGNQHSSSIRSYTGNVAGTAVTDMSHTFLCFHGDLA
jgi:hypothetical protein